MLEIAGTKKTKLMVSSVLSVMSAAMALAPFIVIFYIAEALLIGGGIDQEYIWQLGLAALVCVFIRFVLMYFSIVLSHIAAFEILYELRKKLAEHLSTLPMGFFTRQGSGSIKKIINDDIEAIEIFIGHQIPDTITAIALPAFTLLFLSAKDWRLALISLVPLICGFFAQRVALSDDKDLTPKYHKAMEEMNNRVIEYVKGMPVVKVFSRTLDSFSLFKASVNNYKDFCIKWSKRSMPAYAIYLFSINAILFFVLPAGTWFYLQNSLSVPVFILFLLLGIGYSAPLVRISEYGFMLAEIREGVRRMDAILSQKPVPESPDVLTPIGHRIEFRDVCFNYEEKQVLHDISFTAAEGTTTALVGPSGAGKTTIAQLIPRFWDVAKGEILIGGRDIRQLGSENLMKHVSFVFQDIFLFHDTLLENIRMGQEGSSREEVIQAARASQAHEFIAALPQGYDTVFGAAGTHFSVGEQQRISIARAFLKNAPILILDEATSYADIDNELKIQAGLSQLMKGKTVIVIAHRLSTIKNADQILVIDEGRIMEKGNHRELLSNKGLYRRLWENHTGAQNWKLASIEGHES